jgi:hypothetical protein
MDGDSDSSINRFVSKYSVSQPPGFVNRPLHHRAMLICDFTAMIAFTDDGGSSGRLAALKAVNYRQLGIGRRPGAAPCRLRGQGAGGQNKDGCDYRG